MLDFWSFVDDKRRENNRKQGVNHASNRIKRVNDFSAPHHSKHNYLMA
jgi:hypothetical protein